MRHYQKNPNAEKYTVGRDVKRVHSQQNPTLGEIVVGSVVALTIGAIIGTGILYGFGEQAEINQAKDQIYQQEFPETYKNLMNNK